jgi:hypothetical protein
VDLPLDLSIAPVLLHCRGDSFIVPFDSGGLSFRTSPRRNTFDPGFSPALGGYSQVTVSFSSSSRTTTTLTPFGSITHSPCVNIGLLDEILPYRGIKQQMDWTPKDETWFKKTYGRPSSVPDRLQACIAIRFINPLILVGGLIRETMMDQ